jgi:hypothetical protein
MPSFSYEEVVTEEKSVEVCKCKHCSMEFVYYAVVRDEEGNKSLWPQIKTEFTHCPYCGEKEN